MRAFQTWLTVATSTSGPGLRRLSGLGIPGRPRAIRGSEKSAYGAANLSVELTEFSAPFDSRKQDRTQSKLRRSAG